MAERSASARARASVPASRFNWVRSLACVASIAAARASVRARWAGAMNWRRWRRFSSAKRRALRAASRFAASSSDSVWRAISSACADSTRAFCSRRAAALTGASGVRMKPSQRQRCPSRETSRWPGLRPVNRRAPSEGVTRPHCESRGASSPGASTNFVKGSAPSGSAWEINAAPLQNKDAVRSVDASISSPSAAATARS